MRSYKQQITNSSTYNKSLKQRGSIDFWMDNALGLLWQTNSRRKGYYSDIVIDSLLALNGLSLGVPDYTTVCRGRKTLDMSKKAQKVAPKGKHSFFNRCKRIKMLWGKRMDAIQT